MIITCLTTVANCEGSSNCHSLALVHALSSDYPHFAGCAASVMGYGLGLRPCDRGSPLLCQEDVET